MTDTPQDDLAISHSRRFRKVSNRYPLRVAEAFDRDISRAMAASDDEVAATVAAWETAHGLTPRDWRAIGATERDADYDERVEEAP